MADEPISGTATDDTGADIRTFLIADVRGYTTFTQERGDEAAGRLATRFAEIARAGVEPGGAVLELRGDEVLAVFSSARQAIRAAIELERRFVEATVDDPSLPLLVGIGIDAGEAVSVEGGFRGGALNLAARLCGRAGPGEILASREAVHLARKIDGVAYMDEGPMRLKGLAEAVHVVRVVPEDADPAERLKPYVAARSRSLRLPMRARRRRRVIAIAAAAVLATTVAVVAIRANRTPNRDARRGEASGPRLRLAWTGSIGPRPYDQWVVAEGEHVLVQRSSFPSARGLDRTGSLYVFPAECRTDGGGCERVWSAKLGAVHANAGGPPVASGDVVFASGEDLYAFPLACDFVCDPLWVGEVSGVAKRPVLGEDAVYVASTAGRIYAFPIDCGTNGELCSPLWVTEPLDREVRVFVSVSAVSDGVVYASVIVGPIESDPFLDISYVWAFPEDCGTAGATCRPLWFEDIPDQKYSSGPVVVDGVMYIGTGLDSGAGSLRAYNAGCGVTPSCLLWHAEKSAALNRAIPIIEGDTVYVSSWFGGGSLSAYPTDCGSGGSVCHPAWMAGDLGSVRDPVISGDLVFMVSDLEGIVAYPVQCGTGGHSCQPSLRLNPPSLGIEHPPHGFDLDASGPWVFVGTPTGLHAFKLDSGSE